MDQYYPIFIDPTTDFGFKKLFGSRANKDIIKSFITDVLELETPLVDIEISDKEQLPESKEDRSGIYDIYCLDVTGKHFIVEMQKTRLAYIRDRMIYYSTFPIAAQAQKGGKKSPYNDDDQDAFMIQDAAPVIYGEEKTYTREWNYRLNAIYCIAVLGYTLKDSKSAINRNSIRNDKPPHELFYDKLKFVTIELPLFDENKPEYSLDWRVNKWLYFLKYLHNLDEIPDIFKNDMIFEKAFQIARIANLTPAERRVYERSLKRQRDSYAALETAEMIGEKRGEKRGVKRGKEVGEKIGELKGQKNAIILVATQKLGPMPSEIKDAIHKLDNLDKIRDILTRIVEINDWETLKIYLSSI